MKLGMLEVVNCMDHHWRDDKIGMKEADNCHIGSFDRMLQMKSVVEEVACNAIVPCLSEHCLSVVIVAAAVHYSYHRKRQKSVFVVAGSQKLAEEVVVEEEEEEEEKR